MPPLARVPSLARSVPWVAVTSALLLLGGILVAVFVPLTTLGVIGGGRDPAAAVEAYLGPGGGAARVALRFRDSSSATVDEALLGFATFTSVNLSTSGIQLIEFSGESDLVDSVSRLLERDDVDFIVREFNATIGNSASGAPPFSSFPDDPFFVNASQAYLDVINATGAWRLSTGMGGGGPDGDGQVIVAVIDTGVELDHPDLAGQLWVNPGEIPGNGIDDDGNGYVDDVHGYDFAGGCTSNACTQCFGRPLSVGREVRQPHGTHVAGVVGARQNNGVGVSGVAPHARLMVLKVSDCTPSGRLTSTAIFEAFEYATKMGAHVVSCSFGNDYPQGYYPVGSAPEYRRRNTRAYQAAMKPLSDRGSLILASAGNEDIDLDNLARKGYDYAPCLVDLPAVLCVGATEGVAGPPESDVKWRFSNHGDAVHVGAPGVHVYSTYREESYAPLDGTSISTPMCTGEVALLLQAAPCALSAATVKRILLESADYVPGLPFLTRSRINVGRALALAISVCDASSQNATVTAPGRAIAPERRRLAGWDLTYHDASGNQFSDSIAGEVRGRGALHPVEAGELGFRFDDALADGAIVRARTTVRLGATGWWHFSIAVRDSPGTGAFLYVGGAPVPSSASFLCNATGWVDVEVRLAHPSPAGSYAYRLASSITGEGPRDGPARWMDEPRAGTLRAELSKRWLLETTDGRSALVPSLAEGARGGNGTISAHAKLRGSYVLEALCPGGACALLVGSRAVDLEDCVPLVDTDRLAIEFRGASSLFIRYGPCGGDLPPSKPLLDRDAYQWEYWDFEDAAGRVGWMEGAECAASTCWGYCTDPSSMDLDHGSSGVLLRRSWPASDVSPCASGSGGGGLGILVPITGLADLNGFALFDRVRVVDPVVFGSHGYVESAAGECTAADPVAGVSDTTLRYGGPGCGVDFSCGNETAVVDGYYFMSVLASFDVAYQMGPCAAQEVEWGGARLRLPSATRPDATAATIHAPAFTQVPVRLVCRGMGSGAVYYNVSTVGLGESGGWTASLLGRPIDA